MHTYRTRQTQDKKYWVVEEEIAPKHWSEVYRSSSMDDAEVIAESLNSVNRRFPKDDRGPKG